MKQINLSLPGGKYTVSIGSRLIDNLSGFMNLDRKVFIVTDSGVPSKYAECVKSQCKDAMIYTVPMGETSKSLRVYGEVLSAMLNFGMSRSDCAVAVGGGVVGDLTGFLASSFMRGIDFYNIPTTMLSDVDSSIGGKTGINLDSVKNIVGAFYQPKAVVVDVDLLKTLDPRLISEGLAEAVKMSLTSDEELFKMFEYTPDASECYEEIIYRALMIKKRVVEEDEKESGLRKILNFGHTLGHGIEGAKKKAHLYHGECVALGMMPMCSDGVYKRLLPVLKKLNLPTEHNYDIDSALSLISHDKKCKGDNVEVVFVKEIGKFEIKSMAVTDYCDYIKERLEQIEKI